MDMSVSPSTPTVRTGTEMSGFSLDTPEQINMWVLLSRRSQLKLQMKGLKTPGIIKWCKENIGPECTTAAKALLRLNEVISENGGPYDKDQHVHVLMKSKPNSNYAADAGIFANMGAVEVIPDFVKAYGEGRLELILTNEPERNADLGLIYHFG
jgi:hypothetical protein